MKLTVKKCSAETKCFASIVKLENKKRLSKKQQALIDRLLSAEHFKPKAIYFINGDWSRIDKSKIDPEDLAVLEEASKWFPKDEYLVVPIKVIADKPQVVEFYNTSKVSKKEDAEIKDFVYSYHVASDHPNTRYKSFVIQTINDKVVDGKCYNIEINH